MKKITIPILMVLSLIIFFGRVKAVDTNIQGNLNLETNNTQNTTNNTNTETNQNTTNTANTEGNTDTTNGEQENINTTWTDPAKIEISFTKENDSQFLKISGLNKLEHYIYISNGVEPKPKLDESGKPIGYTFGPNDKIMKMDKYIEKAGDIYVSIVEGLKPEESEKAEYRIVISGKIIDKPAQLSVSNRVYCKFDDEKTIISLLEPHYCSNRKVSIAIGKIEDEKLLERLKEDDKSAFNDLLTYANSAFENNSDKIAFSKEIKTYEIINKEGPSITRDIPMDNGEYYYVWVWIGDEYEGTEKFEGIEDVSLYQAKVGEKNKKELVDYREEGFSWGKDEKVATKEDPEIAKNRAESEKVNNKLMLQVMVGIIIGLIIVIIAVIIIAIRRVKKRND